MWAWFSALPEAMPQPGLWSLPEVLLRRARLAVGWAERKLLAASVAGDLDGLGCGPKYECFPDDGWSQSALQDHSTPAVRAGHTKRKLRHTVPAQFVSRLIDLCKFCFGSPAVAAEYGAALPPGGNKPGVQRSPGQQQSEGRAIPKIEISARFRASLFLKSSRVGEAG